MGWDWTKARTYKVHMPAEMLWEQQRHIMADTKRQFDEYVAYLTGLEGPDNPTERT